MSRHNLRLCLCNTLQFSSALVLNNRNAWVWRNRGKRHRKHPVLLLGQKTSEGICNDSLVWIKDGQYKNLTGSESNRTKITSSRQACDAVTCWVFPWLPTISHSLYSCFICQCAYCWSLAQENTATPSALVAQMRSHCGDLTYKHGSQCQSEPIVRVCLPVRPSLPLFTTTLPLLCSYCIFFFFPKTKQQSIDLSIIESGHLGFNWISAGLRLA